MSCRAVTDRRRVGALRTAAMLFVLFAITACDYPWWSSDHIKITATFATDGSCSFSVDGVTLSDGRYKQRNELDWGSGITAKEFDGYWISCDFPGAMIPQLPTLSVLVVVPKGGVLSPGNYEVSEGNGMATHSQTTVGILDYEKYTRQGFANGITGAELIATEGTFVIDTATPRPIRVGGHLSVIARRTAIGI